MRPRFKDARIHMALNCGAVSCPKLPQVAFEQANSEVHIDAEFFRQLPRTWSSFSGRRTRFPGVVEIFAKITQVCLHNPF
jgi:hypothetical protein